MNGIDRPIGQHFRETVIPEHSSNHMVNKPKDGYITPFYFLILTMISMFVAELFVIFVITLIPSLSPQMVTIFHPLFLIILVFPMLYFFSLRPMIINIAERKRVEGGLKVSEKSYRELVENSLDGIAKTRVEDGMILSANPAYCKLLEYAPDELLGRSTAELDFWVDPGDREELVERVKREGKVHDFEHEFKSKSGGIRTMSSTVRGIYEADGELVELEGTMRDITERIVMERELRERLQMIESQQRAIEELSTPLIQAWKGILIVPLIGVLDSKRAMEVMETLLEEVVRTEAKVVLIDITGISGIDTHTANSLMRTVLALRLIGTESILTGIRPEVARVLVELGVELKVRTESSLEAGLKDGLSSLGFFMEKGDEYGT